MILTWFMGVHGLNVGFSTALRLRAGTMPDVHDIAARTGTMADIFEYGALYAVRATLENPRVTFPLAVAEILLSGLLVIASGLAMGGRRGARGLAMQAILANAAFAALAFALTPFVRAAYVDGVLKALDTLSLPEPQREALVTPGFYHWGMRLRFALHLTGLALAALALTRDRTKTFFEAVARATETREEP
jgi:hypothetical protein